LWSAPQESAAKVGLANISGFTSDTASVMLKCQKLLGKTGGWQHVSFLMCGLHMGNLLVTDMVKAIPWLRTAGTNGRELVKLFTRCKKLG
jgi:hypothetical protein